MMIFVKIFLISCCVSVAFGGGESQCEPFYSSYHEFLQNFLQSIEQRKQAIISDVQNFDFYINASAVEAELTSDNYYTFFINVTAQLANLSTETVEGVLNGTITQAPDPLGCVDESFEIVNQVLSDLRSQVLNVGIEISSSSSGSSSPSQNCTDVSELFPLYSSQLQQILDKRNKLNELDAQAFVKFQASVVALNIAQNENQFLFMVTALADALKIDISFAKELVSGHLFDG